MKVSQPRPLIMMPANTMTSVPMRDLSMTEQVKEYLLRLRQTLPFPLSQEDTYDPCLPTNLRAVMDASLDGQPEPTKAANMKLLLMQNSVQGTRRQGFNALHFSIDNVDDYKRKRFARIFWVECPQSWPAPQNSKETPFFVPVDHPHRAAIRDWFIAADSMHDQMERTLEHIVDVEKICKTPADLRHVWPELTHFVRFKTGSTVAMQASRVRSLDRKVAAFADPIQRPDIITQLSTALMLPEKYVISAWINFHINGDYHRG